MKYYLQLLVSLQRSTIDLTTILPLLNSTILALEKLKLEPADSFKAKVEHLISKTVEEGAGIKLPELEAASNPDIIIKMGPGETERYENQIRQNFVGKVITNVKERFPHAGISEAFSISDPSGMLGEPQTCMEYLSTLLDHYDVERPMGIDQPECEKEYTEFTSFIKLHTSICDVVWEKGYFRTNINFHRMRI